MAMITCVNVEKFVKAVQENANAWYGALGMDGNFLTLTMNYQNVIVKVNCPFYKTYTIVEELPVEKMLSLTGEGHGFKMINVHRVEYRITLQDDWYVRAVLNDAYPHLKLEDKSFISNIIKKAIHAADFRTTAEWKQEADYRLWCGY